jgi:hypothetical protein
VPDYDTLHAIHIRMFAAPDRTLILSHAGEARFSEMALHVLVRRDGSWWLAAGQNAKIDGGAVRQ